MGASVLISVIIPTYNRSKYLLKILTILKNNFLNFKSFEIIICDSFSKDDTKLRVNVFKNNNSNLSVRYINILKNINSIKRNVGVRLAKGKYIIFLDDDCFPSHTFLRGYYNLLARNDKVIYCGSVKYPSGSLKNNFVKYRQSKHFFFKKKDNILTNVTADKIVTMNMALKKNIILKNKIFFNKKFNKYGFEDYEFGFRLINSGFKIVKSHPVVYHYDLRNFELYLKKIKFLGFESMKYLININFPAAKNNNFYKLENFFLVKFFMNFYIFKNLLLLIQNISIFLDNKFIYLPFIYKIALGSAYLEGCFYRNRYNDWNNINNKWYK
jgi:glycosyltransferase involved in cell wall biosynthesis